MGTGKVDSILICRTFLLGGNKNCAEGGEPYPISILIIILCIIFD